MIHRFAALLAVFVFHNHVDALNPLRRMFSRNPGRSIPVETMPDIRPEPVVVPKPSIAGIDVDVKNIFAANKQWIAEKETEDPAFFKKLGSVHKPSYMWIGTTSD
jgi:hypothetical protein